MSWKCPQCGMQNEDTDDACVGMCGHEKATRLVLTVAASGFEIRINVDTEIGRTALQKAAGEEAKYASQPQFRVIRRSGRPRWAIAHCASATNPTCVNAKSIGTDPQPINDGDTISVGPKRLQLKVRVEKSL